MFKGRALRMDTNNAKCQIHTLPTERPAYIIFMSGASTVPVPIDFYSAKDFLTLARDFERFYFYVRMF